MDNRFNVKDLVMISMILMLGALVGFSMWQEDRRWELLQNMIGDGMARPEVAAVEDGKQFVDVFSATVKSLTPLISGDLYSDTIQRYVLDTFLRVDPNTLEFVPWVAERWEISENGLVYTFYMRDDVVFSDGHPMTAEDVVFTYNWTMNPEIA